MEVKVTSFQGDRTQPTPRIETPAFGRGEANFTCAVTSSSSNILERHVRLLQLYLIKHIITG